MALAELVNQYRKLAIAPLAQRTRSTTFDSAGVPAIVDVVASNTPEPNDQRLEGHPSAVEVHKRSSSDGQTADDRPLGFRR